MCRINRRRNQPNLRFQFRDRHERSCDYVLRIPLLQSVACVPSDQSKQTEDASDIATYSGSEQHASRYSLRQVMLPLADPAASERPLPTIGLSGSS
jgi:hypothetical protein